MKKKYTFFKIFWPALTATAIASLLGVILFTTLIGGMIGGLAGGFSASFETREKISPNSLLHVRLDTKIQERSASNLDVFSLSVNSSLGIVDILDGLERAKKDKNIQGVFLEIGNMSSDGYAIIKELRNALIDFKKSGKYIIAYNSGEHISLKKYYLSTCADELYGFPNSNISFLGLASEQTFFKNTFEKLGIEMEIVRGKNNDFKSAVEPFFMDKMSDSNRLQSQVFLQTIWKEICQDIAKERKLSTQVLNKYADELTIRTVNDAVKAKLIDGAKYRDEVITILKKKLKIKAQDDIKWVYFEKYAKSTLKDNQKKVKKEEPNIAVIVASGNIVVDGNGDDVLSSTELCKLIEQARDNKSIQTIVLRINSPGGSALASEEIWREIQRTDSIKPVIVSMSNLAASGGYYIATPASRIFAEPTTITGSIGVFGVIPYIGNFMNNKLGISFDYVQTNKHQALTTNRKLTSEELGVLQDEVDNIYSDFITKVAKGRNMSITEVDKIARGRVWTGYDALQIGLVDELGGLKNAIEYAAKNKKIKNPKILHYPQVQDSGIEAILLEQLQNSHITAQKNNTISAELINSYKTISELEHIHGIQMRLPFFITF